MSETRHITEMTREEAAEIGRACAARAREENFAHGLPVTYENDEGVLVREYCDGTIEPALGADGERLPMRRIYPTTVAAE
ncbi:MAG: hypothetical protein AAFR71_16565 [Pseudomonadota bacterium]